LSLDSSSAINLTGVISGTGALSKLNTNTLTITGAATYVGSTEVTAGGIVFTNNAVPATSGFTGAGTVVIEPSTSFTSAVTSAYSFASTLTGVRLGKASNNQTITTSSAISIAGTVSLYGAGVSINNNIDTRAGGINGDVLVKSSADISLAASKSIKTTGGDVVLWSNSDGQSANGGIFMYANSAVNTGGGHLWMAGGSGTSTWNGLAVGDGYAASGTTITVGALNFDKPAIFMQDTTLLTSGGDIFIRGKTTTFRGLLTTGQGLIDAGNGKIYIEGKSETTGGAAGMGWHDAASALTITSSNAATDAIVWLSDATASNGADIAGEGSGMAGTTSLIATGGGGVRFTSLGSTSQTGSLGIRLGYLTTQGGVLNLLANSTERDCMTFDPDDAISSISS
jgi:hypothetical protein